MRTALSALLAAASLAALPTAAEAAPTESQRAFVVDLKPGKPDSVRNIELSIASDPSDPSLAKKAELRVARGADKPAEQTLRFTLDVGVDVALATAELVDIDFDGYKDFWIVREMGAKWARVEVFLFEPKSGRFVKDGLAREIERIDNPELLPASRSIASTRVGPALPDRVVRKVDGRRLVVTERCVLHTEKVAEDGTALLVIEKIVSGVLKVVSRTPVLARANEHPCLTASP